MMLMRSTLVRFQDNWAGAYFKISLEKKKTRFGMPHIDALCSGHFVLRIAMFNGLYTLLKKNRKCRWHSCCVCDMMLNNDVPIALRPPFVTTSQGVLQHRGLLFSFRTERNNQKERGRFALHCKFYSSINPHHCTDLFSLFPQRHPPHCDCPFWI